MCAHLDGEVLCMNVCSYTNSGMRNGGGSYTCVFASRCLLSGACHGGTASR